MIRRAFKTPHERFEDDLGKLVDDYLMEGIDIEKLKSILQYEAKYDHAERILELRKKEEK